MAPRHPFFSRLQGRIGSHPNGGPACVTSVMPGPVRLFVMRAFSVLPNRCVAASAVPKPWRALTAQAACNRPPPWTLACVLSTRPTLGSTPSNVSNFKPILDLGVTWHTCCATHPGSNPHWRLRTSWCPCLCLCCACASAASTKPLNWHDTSAHKKHRPTS